MTRQAERLAAVAAIRIDRQKNCARLRTNQVPFLQSLLAIVLALLTWTSTVPYLFAPSVQELPACCRKNGKHHCHQNMEATADASVPMLRVESKPCAQYPEHYGAPSHHSYAVLAHFFATIRRFSRPLPLLVRPDISSSPKSQAHLTRGPPRHISS